MDREIPKLTSAIVSGDRSAFEKIFRKLYQPLCNFAWQYVHSSHISEELVQDVFLEIWKNRNSLDSSKSIKSYLYQAVRNKSLNYLKHQKIVQEENPRIDWLKPDSITQIHDFGNESGFINAAQRAIKNLPERAQLVFRLNRKDGLSYNEIAEVLDISPRTVESQISRALKKLRSELSDYIKGNSSIYLKN